jgi:predicted kinase
MQEPRKMSRIPAYGLVRRNILAAAATFSNKTGAFDMAKLVFFVGGAGAGKTTLAKALASKRRAVVLDMDTLLRPAAVALMTLAGLDPDDRDSPEYKRLCRDLGYRITMDAAWENIGVGNDTFVIGPFTKETDDPDWIERELTRSGVQASEVETKLVLVHLPSPEVYRQRIERRSTAIDLWKLDNWTEFSRSLAPRTPKWRLPASRMLRYDNSRPLDETQLSLLEAFVYEERDRE